MTDYETLVHPTDGSPLAAAARNHAVSLADEHDAHLRILSVVPDHPGGSDTEATEDLLETARSRLREEIRAVRETGYHDVSWAIGKGAIRETVIGHADRVDADLVVIGARVDGQRRPLGTTTERLLQSTEVPVLAVEGPDDDGDAPPVAARPGGHRGNGDSTDHSQLQ